MKYGPYYGLTPAQQEELSKRYRERELMVASMVGWPLYLFAAAVILPLWYWWPYRTDVLVLIGIVIFRIAILPEEIACGNTEEGRREQAAGTRFSLWVLFLLIVGSLIRYWT